jgi:hypothetical protein
LEKIMNVKNLIAAVAVFAAAGFKSTQTRAVLRQDLAQAANLGAIAQRQHDGQDSVYVSSNRSRQEVRTEATRSAQSRRAGNVNDLYFGA